MPANMKKSGMSYKKGGSKKMYGGTMKKKKMYGGSKKSMYKKGGSKPDFLDLDKDGNTTEPMKNTYMYGGSMYKKMMKYAGGPVMNEKGMKVPGMMKAGGGLNKMPGGGFMRSMDLPKAGIGSAIKASVKAGAKKAGTALKNLFKKNKNIDTIVEGKDTKNTAFLGVNRAGETGYKFGPDGSHIKILTDNPKDITDIRKSMKIERMKMYGGTMKKKMYGGSKKKMK